MIVSYEGREYEVYAVPDSDGIMFVNGDMVKLDDKDVEVIINALKVGGVEEFKRTMDVIAINKWRNAGIYFGNVFLGIKNGDLYGLFN